MFKSCLDCVCRQHTHAPVNLKLLCCISICLSNEAKLCECDTPAKIAHCLAAAKPTSIQP